MKKLTVIIDDKLDSDFRETVAKNIGYKKGNLQIAIREAINNWVTERRGEGNK